MIVSIVTDGIRDGAFSADTAISEVLIIAKRTEKDNNSAPSVTYVNLNKRPGSISEACVLVQQILKSTANSDKGILKVGNYSPAGHFITNFNGFTGYANIKDPDVAKAAYDIYQGVISLPRNSSISLCKFVKLGDLGTRGLHDLDINGKAPKDCEPRGPFDIEKVGKDKELTTYPILWAQDAKVQTQLIVSPDSYGITKQGQDDRALTTWAKHSSRLCFNRWFTLSSQRLTACLTTRRVIGGAAWPGFVCDEEKHEISIVLFANTILGLIAHWWVGSRTQKGRSMISVTKIPDMITIDPRLFTREQFAVADDIFNRFKEKDFLPANEAYHDTVRKELDQAVLIELLGLPESIKESLDLLRHKWCSEPSVHGGKSTRPKYSDPKVVLST